MKAVESLKSIRLKSPVVVGPPGSTARREWVAGEGVACFLNEAGLVLLEVDAGEGAEALRYRKAWALASGEVEVDFVPVPLGEVEEAPVSGLRMGEESAPAPVEGATPPKRRGRPPKAPAV